MLMLTICYVGEALSIGVFYNHSRSVRHSINFGHASEGRFCSEEKTQGGLKEI